MEIKGMHGAVLKVRAENAPQKCWEGGNSETRATSHVGGSGGMLPQENWEFLTLRALLLLCKACWKVYTYEK